MFFNNVIVFDLMYVDITHMNQIMKVGIFIISNMSDISIYISLTILC